MDDGEHKPELNLSENSAEARATSAGGIDFNYKSMKLENEEENLSSTNSQVDISPIKREIKILPKPAIGLSIGNIVTNGPGKPVTNTYLIVTNLPPTPQPSINIEIPPGKRKNKYRCGECFVILTSKSSLNTHLKEEHKRKMLFHCSFCDKDFCRKHVLENHIKNNHDKQKYKCPKCEENFHLKKLLSSHMQSQHGKEKFYSCPECNVDFILRNAMMNHIKLVHKKEKSFQCDQCDARYSWKKSLNLHIDSAHKTLPQYKCDECSAIFRWKTSLMHHLKVGHKQEEVAQHQCEECSSSFATEKRLMCHKMKSHKGNTKKPVPSSAGQRELCNSYVLGHHRQQCGILPEHQENFCSNNLLLHSVNHQELPVAATTTTASHAMLPVPISSQKHNDMSIPVIHSYPNLPPSLPMPLPYVPYNSYYSCN